MVIRGSSTIGVEWSYRLFTVSRQIVFGNKKEIGDLETEKSTNIRNTALAARGKVLGLHTIIRSSMLTNHWGNPSILSDGMVADVFEAILGSVVYHEQNPHDKLVLAGYMFDLPKMTVNTLMSFFDEGGIPNVVRNDLHYMDPCLQDPAYNQKCQLLQQFQG